MKKRSLMVATILALSVSGNSAMAGGVPTIDVASVTQLYNVYSTNMQQLQEAQQTLESLKGTRNIGQIFSNPAFTKYMPSDIQDLYKIYQSGNIADLAKKIEDLEKSQKVTGTPQEQLAKIDAADERALYIKQIKYEALFKRANDGFNQITRLMNTVDNTGDAKAAADLANRIATENATLQAVSNNLQVIDMQDRTAKEMRERQKQAAIKQAKAQRLSYVPTAVSSFPAN